ncbi:MAG: mitochondrial fission ELM1 family protein [Sphingomonas bacterium]|nr:mitochondrial fission ELM1 family protein [Sphingomonas bacterium]
MNPFPRTWALIGDKTGDNNQLLALAEALGWPFETRSMRYNLLRSIPPRNLGSTTVSLTRASRSQLSPPWPDLLLAIGRRSTPVARWIRDQNKGRTKLVLVGHPRVEPELFDLVISTSQYPVPPRSNVLMLPMAMSRLQDPGVPTEAERAWLATLPRPHLLFAIGGPTKYWEFEEHGFGEALRQAIARAECKGGTLIAVGSRRTPAEVIGAVADALAGTHHRLVEGGMPRFPLLMADADEIFVTGDSVSMLSEAIQTGKPIGMVPIKMSRAGEKVLGGSNALGHGWGYGRRDLRRMWEQLTCDGLVGTVAQPCAGNIARDSVEMAASAVRRMMIDVDNDA